MAIPAAVGYAAPIAAKFIGGLFGGKKKPQDPMPFYLANLKKIMAQMLQFNAAGQTAAADFTIEGDRRRRVAENLGRFQTMFGRTGQATTAANVGSGARTTATRQKLDVRRRLAQMLANFNLSKFSAASGPAASIAGVQAGAASEPSKLGRAGGYAFSAAGDVVGDAFSKQQDDKQLEDLLRRFLPA